MLIKTINKTSNTAELARLLGVSRASLYYQNTQFKKDWNLKCQIEKVLHDFQSYGHKRIAIHLGRNKKAVLRVMKIFGIKPRRRRRKPRDKAKNTSNNIYPNLLIQKQVFPDSADKIWASDFTYLPFKNRFIYLATILDLFTREIVGFNLLTNHTVDLPSNALLHAASTRQLPRILHSDQGREYTSKQYTDLVKNLGIQISMSRKASPWENGYQESFYSHFKLDLGDPNRFETLGELGYNIYRAIHIYNNYRIHTELKMPPAVFAKRH